MRFYTVPDSQRKQPDAQGIDTPITKNKVRDRKIIELYVHEALTMDEIGKRFGISGMRVSRILRKNSSMVAHHTGMEKSIRVNRLHRLLAKTPDILSKRKDVLDVIAELRTELEGKGSSATQVNVVNQNNVSVNLTLGNMIEKLHASRINP